MSMTRILIADNCRDFVYLLVQFLSNYHEFEVVGVAYDGEQAIKMIKQTEPDVLLLDIVMPNMDGTEVLRNICKENSKLRVFIMSAIGMPQLIQDTKDLGARQYFVKPFDFKNVLQAIQG